MSHVQVKVCGITSEADARAVSALGVDAVGFVFWPGSPRAVDVARARRIAAALPPFVLRVGVFVDAPRDVLQHTAAEVGLDVLQLHGHEAPEDFHDLPRRAIKALGVGEGFDPAEALRYAGHADGVLLDARGASRPGGLGCVFDWDAARQVRDGVDFLVLAGGLDPDNVAAGIAALRPDAVDVSSGVESVPGRKDADKVRAFVQAVRAA